MEKSYRTTWLVICFGTLLAGATCYLSGFDWWYLAGIISGVVFTFVTLVALGYDDDRNMRQQREEWKEYDDYTSDREWHRYDNADYWSGEQVD